MLALALAFSTQVKGQSLEIGAFGGGAYMLNDSVRAMPFKNGGWSVGAIARYNFNSRWAARLSYHYGSVDYNRQGKPDSIYNSSIHDISLIGEFNFLDYVTGSKYNTFSPYLFGGASLFYYNNNTSVDPTATSFNAALTFGAGVKYSLTKKIGIGVEWGMRKTFTDLLDQDNYDGTFWYGSDWYNFTGITITYKLDLFKQNRCKELTW